MRSMVRIKADGCLEEECVVRIAAFDCVQIGQIDYVPIAFIVLVRSGKRAK